MSEWISSREAWQLAKEKGVEKIDLIEWARLGRLRARAKSGIFSGDESDVRGASPEERVFPELPYTDEIKRSACGPWPDIPKEFWEPVLTTATWGAGTFASRVTFWCDYHNAEDQEFIELRNVTFNKEELQALLNASNEPEIKRNGPQIKWRQQRVTPRQAVAMQFMEVITRNPQKEQLGKSERHRAYLEWHKKQGPQQMGKALCRTDFNKCADRYEDGWRVEGRRWVPNP